jgi:hypothetical protein
MPSTTTLDCFASFRGSRCPELLRLHRPESTQHIVQFYDDETLIIENVSFLSLQALDAGNTSVIIATDHLRRQIRQRLADFGIDISAVQSSGLYVEADAAGTLARFMVDGWPDTVKFDVTVGGLVRVAERNSASGFVFAFGEMVALLCAAGNPQAAILVEQLWNSLAARCRFSLYCAYPMSSLGDMPDIDALLQICAAHALTIPTETSL